MGHLAQFSSFFKQGEVLCTQGLSYLLQDLDARRAFAGYLSEQVGRSVHPSAIWRTEVRQEGGGRCDLEASIDGKSTVKIEAKLGAAFGERQLASYVTDLQRRCGDGGILFVLVPHRRAVEVTASVSETFRFAGDGPWRLNGPSECMVAVIHWEAVLEVLSTVRSEHLGGDLAQFLAMYRALIGDDIEPPTSDAELLAWREKEGVFVGLVDRVTRRLSPRKRIYPMLKEKGGYQLRYICRPLDEDSLSSRETCFSIGTRDPFQGHKTPIWMRFHHKTVEFPTIHARLEASLSFARRVPSGGHIWIPLEVALDVADGETLTNLLLEQVAEITRIAYQPL
jgi:hypothetical protein